MLRFDYEARSLRLSFGLTMKSITDKAEVSLDFPDKAYMGSFGRESSFDVKVDPEEVLIRIVRAGEQKRQIAVHLHYYLLADILEGISEGLADQVCVENSHLQALRASAEHLAKTLKHRPTKTKAC
jgi:hypothetical protein